MRIAYKTLVPVAAVLAIVGGAVAGSGCSSTPVVLPSRDLDRPTDMAFTCLGVSTGTDGSQTLGGVPMGRCHPSGVQDPPIPGQYRTYAFVANSDRGDLSVIDMSFCRPGDTRCWPPGAALIDLDPDLVGYAAAPLGVLPEALAASQDGCRVISANRGSCDFTFVNPAVLLTPHVVPLAHRPADAPDISTFATTIVPRTSTGRLSVAPGEIAFLPQQTANVPLGAAAAGTYCDANGTFAAPVGTPPATDAASVPWRAIVTFPSCDLIAMLELPSGNVIDSWQVGKTVDSSGAELSYSLSHSGANPICPVADCGASRTSGGVSPDAGTSADIADDANAPSPDDANVTPPPPPPPPDDGGPADAFDVDATSGDDASDDASDEASADAVTVAPGSAQPATGKLNVNALALHPEGTHVYFGATNDSHIGVLDIQGDTLVPGMGSAGLSPGSVELHAGPQGVIRIRLSVDPFAYSKGHDAQNPARPEHGRFVAGEHDNQPDDPLEFLYVIARDGSVRVLDVAEGKPPYECDTGIDPNDPNAQALGGDDSHRKACFPYLPPSDPNMPAPTRLPTAGGPGLRFGGTPQDIAFANYFTPALATSDPNVTETTLSGAFAFVMTTTGVVYVVNIDPELRETKQIRLGDDASTCTARTEGAYDDVTGRCAARFVESPRPLTHSLRDANIVSYSTGLGPQNGPPRLDTPPIGPVTGPSLRSFTTWDSSINPLAAPTTPMTGVGETLALPMGSGPSTYAYFPNRYTVTAQTWALTWQGDLTGVRYTGDVKTSDPAGTVFTDNGAGFCGLGALPGDVLTLVGCTDNSTCAPGTVCVQGEGVPTSVDGRSITGLCLDQNNPRLSTNDNCGQLLKTFRRYEIVSATDSTLQILPRKDEVPRPVYTLANGVRVSCNQDKDCQPEMDTVHAKFTCEDVSGATCEAPCPPPTTKRCLQTCGMDTDCRQGRVCVTFAKGRFCAEAAPINPVCFPQLVSYKLSAGNAFVVSGSAVGRLETIAETAGPMGPSCGIPVSTLPPSVARISMNTARCDPAIVLADPESGRLIDTQVKAQIPTNNSCFMIQSCPTDTMTGVDCKIGAVASPCTLQNGDDISQSCTCSTSSPGSTSMPKWVCGSAVPHLSAFFANRELRFVLGGVEQPIADVFQIRFDVHGGLGIQQVASSLDANPGLPARILLGPIPQPDQTIAGGPPLQPVVDGMMPFAGDWISDLPYLFVVDQRQFTGGRIGARGQILRVTPRVSDTVPVAAFEGFAAGGQYFPLQ